MKPLILVTGGAGYIGSHTVVALHNAGFRSLIVDDFSNAEEDVPQRISQICGENIPFEKVNCLDRDMMRKQVFEKYPDIAAVIHFAAFKAVGESTQKPIAYYRNNIGSLLNLLDLMKEFHCPNFIFSSSCTVYGRPEHLPVDENAPFQAASSPYGATKQISEGILKDTVSAEKGKLRCISLRYFNPVGAHPSAIIGESPSGTPQNLIPFLCQAVAGLRPALQIFGDDYGTPDGFCIRDYIYVMDLAEAHIAALKYLLDNPEVNYDFFNIGTGKGSSVMEVIQAFEKATGKKVPYFIGPRRAGDIDAVWAEASKAKRLLKWQAKTSLEDTLASAWAWQKHISKL